MVKLSYKILRNKIAGLDRTQEDIAEELDISDRHLRNLCNRDTDASVSLCYRMSKFFGTTIEDLLVVQDTGD